MSPPRPPLRPAPLIGLLLVLAFLAADVASAGIVARIAGIRVSQTGSTGLDVNVDVTAFYTPAATFSTQYLGTYFNHIPAIDWDDGSTVPAFGYGPSTGIPLVATSTVVNGVPVRSYRGSFSHTYGGPGNYVIEANTACCVVLPTPTYTLASGTRQTTTFTTYTSFIGTTTTVINSFVRNTLQVVALAPGFSKVFAPDTVAVGATSTLTFTIDNTASTLDDNALGFTDSLPAGLVVATPANVVNTCTDGTVTAASGTSTVTYAGGEVPAGTACTLSVDVAATTPGVFVNTSGDLTSAFGNSGTASDTLTATSPPQFGKSFAPATAAVGDVVVLSFLVDNTANAVPATGVAFTDNLPAGLRIATPADAINTCGGSLTAADGGSVISLSGGTVGAGATCTVDVDVEVTSSGDQLNDAGNLTSSVGTSPAPATATLGVAAGLAEIPTLSPAALASLVGLLALGGMALIRRIAG